MIVAICLCCVFVTETVCAQLTARDRDQAEIENTASPAKTHYWSQFRGPNGSGVALDADPPVKFDQGTNLLWSTPLAPGASSPCIWADRIFLTTYDAKAKKLEVVCLDRNNGKILWRANVKARQVETIHASSSPASATIAADGERIYAYFGSRGLLCYDFDGNLLWTVDMPLPGLVNGSGTSPVVVGDVVLLSREEAETPYLLAVDKLSGRELWRHDYLFPPGKFARNSATPVVIKDRVILHTNAGIQAISVSDGKPIWQVNATTNGISTPVVSGQKLFVTTWQPLGEPANRGKIPTFAQLREHDADRNGRIAKTEFPRQYKLFQRPQSTVKGGGKSVSLRISFGRIDGDKDGEISKDEWKEFEQLFASKLGDLGLLSIDLGGRGDITNTHVRVLEKRNIPEVPSALVHQGRIYLVKDGGLVNCFDDASGKRLFRARLAATGSYFASPIAAGDRIYLASVSGTITVLQAGDEYQVMARNDLSERILATPAIVEGTLYVRADGNLYAFQKTDFQ
jgi:outer membrane protein assembly factor BamB